LDVTFCNGSGKREIVGDFFTSFLAIDLVAAVVVGLVVRLCFAEVSKKEKILDFLSSFFSIVFGCGASVTVVEGFADPKSENVCDFFTSLLATVFGTLADLVASFDAGADPKRENVCDFFTSFLAVLVF